MKNTKEKDQKQTKGNIENVDAMEGLVGSSGEIKAQTAQVEDEPVCSTAVDGSSTTNEIIESSVEVNVGKNGFLYHYDTLQQIVEQLSDSQQPDLDKLIPLVDKAMESYAEIQKRVSAVQKLLDSRKEQFK